MRKIRLTFRFIWQQVTAGLFLFICTVNSVIAEPVYISTPRGGEGQGWLFGSPFDSKCWIAIPSHIIQLSPGGPLTEFRWRDRTGHEGLGIGPLLAGKLLLDSQAGNAGDQLDLAFSPISGRSDLECPSRLGRNNLTSLIAERPNVVVAMRLSMLDSPQHMRVSDFDHTTLTIAAEDSAAQQAIDEGKGISGSPVLFRNPNGVVIPVGLVIQTDPKQGIALAIRFDRVRRAFAQMQSEISSALEGSSRVSLYAIDKVYGRSTDVKHGQEGLADDTQCWQVSPNQNNRSIDVDISIAPENTARTLIIRFDSRCGRMPDSIHLHRPVADQWMLSSDCVLGDTIASCQLNSTTISQVKIVIISRSGTPVGIHSLQFQ